MLLLKIKLGLFASVTLLWTHLFLSQFTHLCGMCFCVLKKQLLYHPQVQVLLVDSASKPSRCSLGNNPILVHTDFGVKMLLSPSLWKTCECFLFPPHPCNFNSPTGKQLLREEAALGTRPSAAGIGALPSLEPAAEGCAGYSPSGTQAAPGHPWEATAPWHWYFWTSHWQNKQNLPFWIQLPFSPLGKYKLKLILTVLNNSTCTITAVSLPPTMRNAV